jgi:hypothetical protein
LGFSFLVIVVSQNCAGLPRFLLGPALEHGSRPWQAQAPADRLFA